MTEQNDAALTASKLVPLLGPKSVAIIGASDDPRRIGGQTIDYMLGQKFDGMLLPVNPNRSTVQGLPAYTSVADLPVTPDAAIIAVGLDHVIPAVTELAQRGTKGVIVFTAGFAETGQRGRDLQNDLVTIGQRHGTRILGPNCLGLFDARRGYYATFSSCFEQGFPRPGRVGIASQSGALGSHMVTAAWDRGLGTPVCITTGNESDVTVGEALCCLVADPDIDIVMLIIEGVRDAGPLLAGLDAARSARKPVIVLKVGYSDLGTVSAQSHTAAIAGSDAVFASVLAESGAFRARSIDEMLDIAYCATRRIYPVNNTLGVLTGSGGAGILISDAAEDRGVDMPPMPEAAQAKLLALVPFASARNPVDCTAQVINDVGLIAAFAETILTDGGYSSLIAFFSQTGGSAVTGAAIREQLRRLAADHPNRLIIASILAARDRVEAYERAGLLVFPDPGRAVTAVQAMGVFGAAFSRSPIAPAPALADILLPDTTPSEADAKALLAQIGITAVPERACATELEAVEAATAFGFPVVMKILSPDIMHKSEIGGVLLGLRSADAVKEGFATVMQRARAAAPTARIDGVLVSRQIDGGVECILGIQRDPVFGPVAVFGLGGIYVETMKDVVLRRCPFGEDVADRMIRSIRGAPILLGARGRPAADIGTLAAFLARLSVFAANAGPRLSAVDINPVFAMPDGAFAADAVIEVAHPPGWPILRNRDDGPNRQDRRRNRVTGQ